MPDTTSELRRTFDRVRAQPPGEVRTVALETLLEAVDADGEQPLLNEVLNAIVSAYRWSEDSMRQLTAFGRLLRNLETEPEWISAEVLASIYWWMHTMAMRMLERPDVPLASIEEFLVRMRGCYAEAGRSLYPSHQVEYALAAHLGDDARRVRALAALDATEPDYIDDCEPCVHQLIGAFHAEAGDYERAVELWEPMLEHGMRCPFQPHESLAASLMPLVELGRPDRARANHLHGSQLIRGRDELVLPFVDHVRFCALTGNEARAVELLASRPDLFTLGLDPMYRLRLLESAQLTCRALAALGRGDAELPGPDGRRGRAEELHDRIDAERREICGRFDRRNGGDVQSRRSQERVAFTGAHPHIPLGLKATVDHASSLRAEPPASSAADLERLLAEARAAVADFADDRLERWKRIGDAAARLGAALDPADEAEVLVACLNDAPGPQEERELQERAVALLRATGREGRALSLEAAALRDRKDDAFDEVRAEAARLLDAAARIAGADPIQSLRTRTAVHTSLAELGQAHGREPDPQLREAIAALDAELAARPDERGARETRVRLLMVAAKIAPTAEDGRAAMRTAYELADTGGHALETVVTALYHAKLLRAEGRREEALAVAENGVAALRPWTSDDLAGAIHSFAAETAVSLEHWGRAELYAVRAAHHHDRAGSARSATAARHLAGLGMAMQRRDQAAILVLEEALHELAEAPEADQWRSVDARILLADAYERSRDMEEASQHALEALRLMDGGVRHPDPAVYARTAHTAGWMLEQIEDYDSAVLAYERAGRASRELGDLPNAAMSIRAAAWAGLDAGQVDRRTGSEAFGPLAAELREAWGDEALPPDRRESCRQELAETLFQHAGYLGEGEGPEPVRLLRAALEVFAEDGSGFGHREFEAVQSLLRQLKAAGDREGVEAVAERTLGRFATDADPAFRKEVEESLARFLDAAA